MQADVIIVGAGMVGSSIALALEATGLDIMLLDGGALTAPPFQPQAPFEPRVSALSIASQNVLHNLGAWQGVLARRACPYEAMHVWDGSGTGSISFSAASVQAQVLGHIVENRIVCDALLDRLQQSQVALLGEVKLEQLRRSKGGWLLGLDDGNELRAKLLVAADGANSSIRRMSGTETREWDYLHHAVVTSVRCSKPHQNACWQSFTDEGPLALLPLTHANGGNWCSIVWSLPPQRAQEVMSLSDEEFCQQLGTAFEHRLGIIEHADARFSIPLRQRHVKRYMQQGLVFAGDAAHVIHPLAGQGVNLGFFDVADLAQVISSAVARGEDFSSEQVLSRYERARMPQNLSMMAAMQGFQQLFQSDNLAVRLARNIGLRQVDKFASAKAMFVRQALGVGMKLPPLAQRQNEATVVSVGAD